MPAPEPFDAAEHTAKNCKEEKEQAVTTKIGINAHGREDDDGATGQRKEDRSTEQQPDHRVRRYTRLSGQWNDTCSGGGPAESFCSVSGRTLRSGSDPLSGRG
jgi:hypothetical protein